MNTEKSFREILALDKMYSNDELFSTEVRQLLSKFRDNEARIKHAQKKEILFLSSSEIFDLFKSGNDSFKDKTIIFNGNL